ncbi:MAG: SDR family oxidoreductase [Patescibacteria group bacterium]
MKILILGSQGNLGTQLMKVFFESQVVGLDRNDLDFLDFNLLGKRLKDEMPDLVINAAAYNAVDKCETEPLEKDLAIKLNIDLPAYLAGFCLLNNLILVHYSTDYVFSGDKDCLGFDENSKTNPINFYGQSKANGEQEVRNLGTEGLKYYLIRTSKLFGPLGSSPYAKPGFFDMMIELAQNRSALKSVDEEFSCFTFTPDLAVATKNLVFEKYPFGIYHLINDGKATWYDGALEAFKIKGLAVKVTPVSGAAFPRPAKRPVSSILKNTKVPAFRSWKEALAEYLNKN